MRNPRVQLPGFICDTSTKRVRSIPRSRRNHPPLCDVGTAKSYTISSIHDSRLRLFALPPIQRATADCSYLRRPQQVCRRRYGTAHAVPLPVVEEQDAEPQEEQENVAIDFLEHPPTHAGRKLLKQSRTISKTESLNIPLLVRKISQQLSGPGSIVTFDRFALWDDVVPILAEMLGVRHTIMPENHPYLESIPQRGSFHLLTRLTDTPLNMRQSEESLVKALYKPIFEDNVDLWVYDFGQHADMSDISYPYWKVFMLICDNTPSMLPKLEIVPGHGHSVDAGTIGSDGSCVHQLKLINENHNVLVVEMFSAVGELTDAILWKPLHVYLKAIRLTSSTHGGRPLRFAAGSWEPAEFLSRAISALAWGNLDLEAVHPDGALQSVAASDLWQINPSTAKHGLFIDPILWFNKKHARRLAILRACEVMKGHLQAAHLDGRLIGGEYNVFARFWSGQERDVKNPETLIPDPTDFPVEQVTVNESIVSNMIDTLRSLVQAGFQSSYEWLSSEEAGLGIADVEPAPPLRSRRLDRVLYHTHLERRSPLAQPSVNLPVCKDDLRSQIIQAVHCSAVTIITAATGSGKTTQVPQLILDERIASKAGSTCSIVCTQPRRVSTISVARRVASERGQWLGEDVGYKVRFDSRPPRLGYGITYMTSGYLLRLMEADAMEVLSKYSHIILDEVHARDVDTDIMLANLKNHLGKRTLKQILNMPKIILMSASIDAAFFRAYFEDIKPPVKITTLEVPGKLYEVESKTLDHLLAELKETYPIELATSLATADTRRYVDEQLNITYDEQTQLSHEIQVQKTNTAQADPSEQSLFVPSSLIHMMIHHLLTTTSRGDILVFLPGLGEIDTLETLLLKAPLSQIEFSTAGQHRIFKLHSALYETNYDVFKEVPSGCRRIVLATNIAETSITLPDVKFVIDTGLSRQNTFDQLTRSDSLKIRWISKAEVLQRKGRAGRTQAGIYYGLYSQACYDAMPDAPIPEILRMSLEKALLRSSSNPASQLEPQFWPRVPGIKDLQVGHSLLTTPSPPDITHVAAAGHQLHHIHALTTNGRPTSLGLVLSRIPMNPTAAKTVLLGMIFRCLDATLIFGALREDSPLMYDATGIGATAQRRKRLANGTDDDKWADSQAFFSYDRMRRQVNQVGAEELKRELSLRHDAYCEYAQIARQTFDTVQRMMPSTDSDGLDCHELSDVLQPLFPVTPSALNTNSGNSDLVKALVFSTAGNRFACWNHKNWRTHLHPRVLPHPKSVNHNSNKRDVLAQRERRENGDLLSFATMRKIPKDKYPWLHDTSVISPLMAILFGESVSYVASDSAFIINGWVKYQLTTAGKSQDVQRAAKIIWEYRKALDRFIAHAMHLISLEPHKTLKVQAGEFHVTDFNAFLQPADSPVRKLFVDSVMKILEIDAGDRADRLKLRALETEIVEPVAESKSVSDMDNG